MSLVLLLRQDARTERAREKEFGERVRKSKGGVVLIKERVVVLIKERGVVFIKERGVVFFKERKIMFRVIKERGVVRGAICLHTK